MNEWRAGIALGSNLGDRLANLRRARERLLGMSGVGAPCLVSKVYETEPVGCEPGAGPFLNAVLEVNYRGQPQALLRALQEIEAEFGRPSKRPRNAPRTLDLDLLYLGDLRLSHEEFTLPHPRLHQRRFVLVPLADVAPELLLPGQQQTVAQLLAALDDLSAVTLFSASWEA